MPAMLMFLAHQGGWDEALFVAIPLALIFAAVHTAKRRAESRGSALFPDMNGRRHAPASSICRR